VQQDPLFGSLTEFVFLIERQIQFFLITKIQWYDNTDIDEMIRKFVPRRKNPNINQPFQLSEKQKA
jgi:hypothetical protein